MNEENSSKVFKVEVSYIYRSLVNILEKDLNHNLSIENKDRLVEYILNKPKELSNLDEYIAEGLCLKENVFITYRKDIFKRVNYLKKNGINNIVLFIYKETDNNLRSLIDFMSNKINIKVVQVNNVDNENKFKTNTRKNVFILNLLNGSLKEFSSFLKSSFSKKRPLTEIIYREKGIRSQSELISLKRILKERVLTIIDIRFVNNFYKYSEPQSSKLDIESYEAINNAINKYERKLKFVEAINVK